MNKRLIILILLLLFILLLIINQTNNSSENDKVLYIPNFLSDKDYQKILKLREEGDGFIFENFRHSKPLKNQLAYDIFYNSKYINQLEVNINKRLYPSTFPIEHRYYSQDSQGMQWHKDLLMYIKPQYEGIFTIRNNTLSRTEWKDSKGILHSLWTEPNSLLLVRADGYEHHVTTPLKGEREILKLIYTQTDQPNQNYESEMQRFKEVY